MKRNIGPTTLVFIMKKLLGSLALGAMIVAVAPRAALAQGVPIKGTFTVAATVTPNTDKVTFCGGTPLDLAVEAHGAGYSTLGALSLSLQKTIAASGPAMHGCLELTAPNGDTLSAIYDGTGGAPNANNFIVDATGTLTFTGGTGRFRGASGSAHFTAVFYVGRRRNTSNRVLFSRRSCITTRRSVIAIWESSQFCEAGCQPADRLPIRPPA